MPKDDGAPSLRLELRPPSPKKKGKKAPQPKTVYVPSCSQDCDLRLHAHGHERASGFAFDKADHAEMGEASPCTVCAKPTKRMTLVYKGDAR